MCSPRPARAAAHTNPPTLQSGHRRHPTLPPTGRVSPPSSETLALGSWAGTRTGADGQSCHRRVSSWCDWAPPRGGDGATAGRRRARRQPDRPPPPAALWWAVPPPLGYPAADLYVPASGTACSSSAPLWHPPTTRRSHGCWIPPTPLSVPAAALLHPNGGRHPRRGGGGQAQPPAWAPLVSAARPPPGSRRPRPPVQTGCSHLW